MIVHKITSLVNKTSEITQYSPAVIADVVGYTLKYTKEFLDKPTHAGIRIRYFGVFRPKLKALNFYLKSLILKLRVSSTPELIEEFRVF
jgi:hypothetical protein